MTATDLINKTREGFALVGLCCMHQTDVINPFGEVENVVVVSPAFMCGEGVAIRYTKLETTDRMVILEDVVRQAEESGVI